LFRRVKLTILAPQVKEILLLMVKSVITKQGTIAQQAVLDSLILHSPVLARVRNFS